MNTTRLSIVSLSLVLFLTLGCLAASVSQDNRWLAAAKAKVERGDLRVSTSDARRRAIFSAWAHTQGFAVITAGHQITLVK